MEDQKLTFLNFILKINMVNIMYTNEESILKPGERESREIVGYIQMLLDSLNDFMIKYKSDLQNLGVMNRLVVLTEIITMHKYNPEIYMSSNSQKMSYWDELVSIIQKIKQDQKLAKDLSDIEDLINKINELRVYVRF